MASEIECSAQLAASTRTVIPVEWRITYFVKSALPTPDGWLVEGEPGLGPPQAGDEFSFVLHQDVGREDLVILRVERYDGLSMLVVPNDEVELRADDILGGEVDRDG
jgi:hypothetical protein